MHSSRRRYRSTSHLPSASDNVNITDGYLPRPLPSYHEVINNSFLTSDRDRSLVLNVDVSRNASDVVTKKRTRGRSRDPNGKENLGPRNPSLQNGINSEHSVERGMHRYSSMSDLPSKSNMDSYVPYGNKQNQPGRTKWLAYAKTIKSRQSRDSNLTKASSMDNIDVIDKYPRLQHSDFYQRLHMKYPQAFHRRLPHEPSQPRRHPRRLFNSGLRVHFEDEEIYAEDNRSICSERPVSQYERDIRERLGQSHSNDHSYLDRHCRTSPTPSMASDLSVKERLDATSERLHRLLYDSSPFLGKNCHNGYSHDSEVTTPRNGELRSCNSRTSSISSDVNNFNNSDDVLLTPRNHDASCDTNSHNLSTAEALNHSQEEKIKALQEELKMKDKEIQNYRKRLDFDQKQSYAISHLQRNSKNTQPHFDINQWGMFHTESPPDSAIDVDSASVQSLVSADKFVLSNENFLNDAKLDAMIPIDAHLTEALDIEKFSMESIMENDYLSLEDSLIGVSTVNKHETQNIQASKDNTVSGATESGPKDSDEDSGIVQATNDQKQDDNTAPADDIHISRAEGTELVCLDRNEQVTPTPGGSRSTEEQTTPSDTEPSSNKNDLLKSSSEMGHEPDEPAITEELSEMSQNVGQNDQQTACSRVHFEDEVDDSDPRFGGSEVPKFNDVEKEIRHKYLKKKRYNVRKKCLTARDQSVSDSSQSGRPRSRSEDLSSVYCASTAQQDNHGMNVKGHSSSCLDEYGNKILANGQDIAVQDQLHVPGILRNGKIISARKMASESDMRRVGTDQDDDPPGSHFWHTRHFSASCRSSNCSSNTLVGSQLSINQSEDRYVHDNESVEENYPRVSGPSHKRRFHLKKIFHPRKKGHYNPSDVEENYPVDLQSMMQQQYGSMPNLSKENLHHGNVQYRKARKKSGSVGDLLEESRFDGENLVEGHVRSSSSDHISAVSGVQGTMASDIHGGYHGDRNQKCERKTQNLCNEEEMKKQNQSLEMLPHGKTPASNIARNDPSQLTAYDAAVSLDESGLDIDEIIDSDSDNVFSAKPVVIDKSSKHLPKKVSNDSHGFHQQKTDTEVVKNENPVEKNDNNFVHSPADSVSSFTTVSPIEGSPIGQRSYEVKGARPKVRHSHHENGVAETRNDEKYGIKEDNSGRKLSDKESSNSHESRHIYPTVNVHCKTDDDIRPEKRKCQLSRELSISTPDILNLSTNHRQQSAESSNLVKCKELSASKQSLSDRVKKSAKSKFKAFRKAVSSNKDDPSQQTDKEKKARSGLKMPKIKNPPVLRGLFGKKKSKQSIPSEQMELPRKVIAPADSIPQYVSCVSIESLDNPQLGESQPIGTVQNFNSDGTQVIQLRKPKQGPLGIFIARGNSQFKKGIFVSRFLDDPTEQMYASLLSVGDEILEVNSFVVKDLALDDIYDIMSARDIINMKILPLVARKDI